MYSNIYYPIINTIKINMVNIPYKKFIYKYNLTLS